MSRFCPNPSWLILFGFILLPCFSLAQLQVNAVSSTPSTCANNGSITVHATTTAPPLLYSIITGPTSGTPQTDSVFSSLLPGSYTVRVSDAASNSSTKAIIVTGNYLLPDMAPISIAPYCTGGSNGQLIGSRTPGTGNGPFTWQLIAPSPITTAPQPSDTFSNLSAGNYTLQIEDACGGLRTTVVTITDPPNPHLNMYTTPNIVMVGCDSAVVLMNFHADLLRFPLTCKFVTSAGTFTTTTPTKIDTTSQCCGYFTMQQLLPNFTYGNSLQITITDNCGNVLTSPTYSTRPFSFCTQLSNQYVNCAYQTMVNFALNTFTCGGTNVMSTYLKPPVSYVVTDLATNTVVDTDTLTATPVGNNYPMISGFDLKPLPPNQHYTITIKDSCNHIATMPFTTPTVVTPTPRLTGKPVYPSACVDSAAFAFVDVDDFKTEPKLILLSGPAKMRSTKPGYEYEVNYSYPDTIDISGVGTHNYSFSISNLAVGTYTFKVIDSCGSEILDQLTVQPSQVTDFHHTFTYKKGCLGKNELHYTITGVNGMMWIRNIATGATSYKYYQSQNFGTPLKDSVTNLPSGTYELTYTYASYYGGGTSRNISVPCQVIIDTVVIAGYQTPTILTSNYLQCKGSIFMEAIPDSSKGVIPYEYEIISGPQLFPKQNDNVFPVTSAGTYTVRIYDICGNASTAQTTVTPVAFPPIAASPFACNSIQLVYPSSPYYSYHWKAPAGNVYIGDTLSFNPVTTADTGIYTIARITDIHGCRDTAYDTYHVTQRNSYTQHVTICGGNTVVVGAHTYSSTGHYTDTLTDMHHCDSIIQLHLTVLPAKRDTIQGATCPGLPFLFNGKSYGTTGFYSDTIPTAGCDSIITLQLSVSMKKDSVSHTICQNTQYNFNGRLLTTPGIYRDTLSTATCDSIIILNLSVLPFKQGTVSKTICINDQYNFNGQIINVAGTYRDTLPTATCDSIITLHLSVLPFKQGTVSKTICINDQYNFNGQLINVAGTYRDTLPTATCDSIVTLHLSVVSPTVAITATPQSIFTGNAVQLEATSALSYLWSGAGVAISNATIYNPLATLSTSAWIYLQANSNPDNCLMLDSVFITVIDHSVFCEDAYIYLPSAFTPNRDGKNDVFRILGNKVSLKSFQIFNRWGEQVFVSNDIERGWDGLYKGKILPATYVYFVIYTDCAGQLKTMKGSITLIL